MATSFSKIEKFTLNVGGKDFDLANDTLTRALTNTAHTASWDRLSDLTEVSYTNLSSRVLTTTSWSQTSGTAKLILADLVLTSSGGTTGPFQYIYIYDETATNDELVGYYDFGSALTLNDGDTLTLDFDGSAGVLTIA